MRKLFQAAVAVAVAGVATPAMAVLTPFASFSPVGTQANIKLVRSGTTYTIGTQTNANQNNSTFGSVKVQFQFLSPALASLGQILSDFTLLGTSTATPTQGGGFDMLGGFTGTLSFKSVGSFTYNSTVYAAGTNLLSIDMRDAFTSAQLSGANGGTTGSFNDSTAAGGNVVFTSELLSFGNTEQRDFSLTFVSLTNPLSFNSSNNTLRNFKASANGLFSSEPPPLVNGAVPEIATWAMMLVGLGGIGSMMRGSRRRQDILAR